MKNYIQTATVKTINKFDCFVKDNEMKDTKATSKPTSQKQTAKAMA